MGASAAFELFADAPGLARHILDARRAPVDEPIRSEIFGPERFEQHARSLAAAQRVGSDALADASFFPRIFDNARVLRRSHALIGNYARAGLSVSPAAEWLLDNFHVVESQLVEIRDGLPRHYFRRLPKLADAPLTGMPRVYGIAWAYVAHTGSDFDLALLKRFVAAYQEVDELDIGELWALPTTLRVVLIENLRRMAERIVANTGARDLADACCDREGAMSADGVRAAALRAEACGVGHAFLAQVHQRLQNADARRYAVIRQWMAESGANATQAVAEWHARQSIANVTVRNIMTSLRRIGGADWKDVVESLCAVDRAFAPVPAFRHDDFETRDACRHAVELLARRSHLRERAVAEAVLAKLDANERARAHPAYFLIGPGRRELARGLAERTRLWSLDGVASAHRLAIYLVVVGALTSLVVFAALREATVAPLTLALAALLLAFPASEIVVSLVNRIVSELAPPARIPRRDFSGGIPPEHRVLVAIPALIGSIGEVEHLARQLVLHYLANPERHAQFALLTDFTDAATETCDGDDTLIAAATAAVQGLNTAYPSTGAPPRFLLLHRGRSFNAGERMWIGWERKRGKLEQLVRVLTGEGTPFVDLGALSVLAPGTRYVVALDSDTQTTPGAVRSLVAIAAHPLNAARPAPAGRRRVVAGYGILQPRVVPPLPRSTDRTWFHWLFAGQCGIDPYSAATSEVYQDVFGTGTFTGKGLLDVAVMRAMLDRRVPENTMLSHDLFEGSVARCGYVSDVVIVEDAPAHAEVAAARTHRWTRGDWQLLPFLLRARRYGLDGVARWKIVDNLRRSLIAPCSLVALALAWATGAPSPGVAMSVVLAAFGTGPLLGALAGLSPSRDGIALAHFVRLAAADFTRAIAGALWQFAMLLRNAWLMHDAILRTLLRLVRRRRLLQWVTAAQVQAAVTSDLGAFARRHAPSMLAGVALFGAIALWRGPPAAGAWGMLALLAASPLWAWWASRRWPPARRPLSAVDRDYLHDVARETWRYFERHVDAPNHHLPPDNVQLDPHTIVAHRTSPTNIGLYLLSCAAARELGFIGTRDMAARLAATLDTVDRLAHHAGHLLNWYDTRTLAPLDPPYVSTVDSGNLAAHLWAVAQACRVPAPPRDVVDAEIRRAHRRARAAGDEAAAFSRDGAIAAALAGHDSLAALESAEVATPLLAAARAEVEQARAKPASQRACDAAEDFLSTLASHALESTADASRIARDLTRIAERAERLANRMQFRFLYDGERNLFRIGYRVDRGELDAGTYDLLASEARLASYVAICKRQVPMRHWFALGRPFVSVGGRTTLRSWSGSMFEYLMPSLVLDEPEAGMVHQALATAVDEQMRYGRARRLPWGVSESAYGAQDHTLAYQYSGFGVPTLALKRSAADDYVVAPYASALAAMLVPAAAVVNLRAIEDLNARQSCGFIDALDFTTRRRSRTEPFRLVRTFMAHHQGMTLVALCDVLAAHAPRRWFHASARVTAFEALLEERAPREVMLALPAPLAGHGTDLVPAVEFAQSLDDDETREGLHAHALSNGRYSVLVFADGAGWSRRGSIALTRWRDDALRHVGGSFVFVRETQGGTVRGLAASPPMKGATTYRSTFLADRVVSEVRCAAYEATLTVLVSPEDDVEMRDVALRNSGDEPLDIEFVSYLEPVLATQAAEDAHPAFSNLFVGVRFDPSHGVLMFERRPRNERETAAHLAHFVVPIEGDIGPVEAEVDRRHFIGRGRTLSSAAALARAGHREDGATPGLDPVASLRVRVRVPPRGRTRVLFATAAGDTPETLWGHVDKYRTPANLERASLMSATLADIRLRELGIGAPEFGALLRLTPLVAQTMPAGARPGGSFQRRYLWRHGISGDRPIVVVAIGAVVGLGLLRAVMRAREFWQFAGIVVDVVVLNGESQSYIEPVGSAIGALVATSALEAEVENQQPAVFVLRRDALTDDEHRALAAQARLVLEADGRPFEHHVNEVVARRRAARSRNTAAANGVALPSPVASRAGGDFDVADGAYVFEVDPKRPPARPWVNVIANPHFGFQVSETGAGFTWAGNSRLHQLTSWSNDPVLDTASEWLVLEDVVDRRCYALLGGQPPDARVPMQVRHGFGHSTFETRIGDLDVEATVFAAPEDSVKWTVLRLRNTGRATRRVRVLATAEWTLGATRSERRYVAVRKHPGAPCIFATRTEHGDAWAGGAAFLAACADNAEWTGDRREFYPTRGVVDVPATLLGAEGSGLDACAALRVARSVAPGAEVSIAFALGYAPDEAQAESLAQQCLDDDALAVLDRVRAAWRSRLGALRVETPDPRFDALVNGWLPYQAIACRLWARAGFYQVGGAYGFRDQLQDAMGVALLDPSLLRRQLLLHASRQFREGDVQHWWHPPTGAGVRTRFSDDRLWLPYACLRYLDVTTDAGVLDESVPFLEGEAVPDGAEDAYYVPTISDARASLFEHCARAIDASLATGAHGLPLMGAGDWNDGMNRVGAGGRGESVWLGWFLCAIVDGFAPLAAARGEAERADRWRAARAGWHAALEAHGWDGAWYRRAFFDDGTPLGSAANDQCSIDLIAQTWAVMSGAALPSRARTAMASAAERLMDARAGVVRLLDPPFASPAHDPGYIKDYPPGVRENGSQYAHAAAWAVMAFAALGDAERAFEAFRCISPAHRIDHEGRDARYELEPYVVAGDVYSAPPYVGRGGWSWYTGAAAWTWRAAVESLLGFRVHGNRATMAPCLPAAWRRARLYYRHGTSTYEFVYLRDAPAPADGAFELECARGDTVTMADDGGTHRVLVRDR